MTNEEQGQLKADELVILQKFEGEALPENEFERVTISNGIVVSHEEVSNGEVVGPVPDSEIVGANIGQLTQTDKEVE